MTEPPAYDMSFASLAIRPGGQRQLQQQQNFYAPQYGGPVMPASSSLLGPQIAQAPNHTPPRGTLTYQPLLPPIAPGAHDYAPTPYGHNVQLSAGVPFLPAPGAFTWQSSFYSQPYIQSRLWEQQSLISRSTRPTTILGTLPREAWERVFQYLDYADRLRLQSVNKFWAESLKALDKRIKENPSDADFADMHSLVLQAENYRKHWAPSMAAECKTHRGRPRNGARNARTPPDATKEEEESKGRRASMGSIGKLGCYHCFTVRPPDKFCLKTDEDDANIHGSNEDNDNQPKTVGTGPAPRRYCLDCGIKKGYHPPNKYLERKWGIEVWICCGAYYDHGVMNCPTCKRGCPLTPVTKTSRNSGKRSSPMPPPPSRPRKQQRTAAIDPLGQGRSIGYPQQYLQDHNPQSWC
ncbi:hypothetical protein BR93DRAFT_969336 [Coniochaeta sp. PMI_546]|nr:hypothetical protein BR93DRAFT_969336 [Coniochaeta sp. PMI_546]